MLAFKMQYVHFGWHVFEAYLLLQRCIGSAA
jgi:hypothetical protein